MQLQVPQPPRLPNATPDYKASLIDNLTNILRLYFDRLSGVLAVLLSPRGGQYLNNPYGAYQSNTTQTVATINTPTLIYLEVTDYENGTYRIVGDGIHVEQSGIYNVQFSAQTTNDDTQARDAAIWFRKNGVDFSYSNSVFTVPSTHGGLPGYYVVAANFFMSLTAGDYVEMWWSTNSTQVMLQTLPPITTPFIAPGAPAVVCTLSFVSSLPT